MELNDKTTKRYFDECLKGCSKVEDIKIIQKEMKTYRKSDTAEEIELQIQESLKYFVSKLENDHYTKIDIDGILAKEDNSNKAQFLSLKEF